MASGEILSCCPSVVILSSCYKERIKNENKILVTPEQATALGSSLQGQAFTEILLAFQGEGMERGA